MCGRFALFAPREEIEALFELRSSSIDLPPRYNIAPTQPVAAVRHDRDGQRELVLLRWGLIPYWAREASIGNRMINARAESVAGKPAYRESFRRGRRCLIPASGFYEWTTTALGRRPYFIAPAGGGLYALAGLWDRWRDRGSGETIESCTIVTVASRGAIADLHDRMPLSFTVADHAAWLSTATPSGELQALLDRAAPGEPMLRPVGRAVNNPRNDDASLIEASG